MIEPECSGFSVAGQKGIYANLPHYWDSRRAVGARYQNWVPSDVRGPIEWDAFYLSPADAVWTGEAPPMLLAAGRTILETRRSLEEASAHLSP